jgi:hypothetical protein
MFSLASFPLIVVRFMDGGKLFINFPDEKILNDKMMHYADIYYLYDAAIGILSG